MKSQKEITLGKDLQLRDRQDIYRNFLLYCMSGDTIALPMGSTVVVERDQTEFARLSQLGDILGLAQFEVAHVHSELAEQAYRQQVGCQSSLQWCFMQLGMCKLSLHLPPQCLLYPSARLLIAHWMISLNLFSASLRGVEWKRVLTLWCWLHTTLYCWLLEDPVLHTLLFCHGTCTANLCSSVENYIMEPKKPSVAKSLTTQTWEDALQMYLLSFCMHCFGIQHPGGPVTGSPVCVLHSCLA